MPSIILKWWIVGHVSGGLLGIHPGLSNFNCSNASASYSASCRIVSTKFQSFKHTSALTVSRLRPHLLSDTTLPLAEKDAFDAIFETGTDNISRAIMESMGYLLWFVFHQPNKSNDPSSSISSKGWFK